MISQMQEDINVVFPIEALSDKDGKVEELAPFFTHGYPAKAVNEELTPSSWPVWKMKLM